MLSVSNGIARKRTEWAGRRRDAIESRHQKRFGVRHRQRCTSVEGNASRRHKFDKAQYRVINWAEYNESLRQRGDLTIWVSDEAQSVWSAPRRTSRGGQCSNASPDATAWERANSISAPIHATTLRGVRSLEPLRHQPQLVDAFVDIF